MSTRVLIVEDNQTIREATKDYFISKSNGEMKVISVGSGLGLAIARNIADIHKYKLSVDVKDKRFIVNIKL